MSSCDGTTLEFFVRDSIFSKAFVPAVMRIIVLLEPHRDYIENAISDFDEEIQSWRGYRNSLWDVLGNDCNKEVDNILTCQNPIVQACALVFGDLGQVKQQALYEVEDQQFANFISAMNEQDPKLQTVDQVRTVIISYLETQASEQLKNIVRNFTYVR